MKRHLGIAALVAGSGFLAIPASASAQAHTHDGFMFRGTIGGAYLGSSTSLAGTSVSASGGGVSLDLAFGGAVARNLIVHGGLLAVVVPSPHIEFGTLSGTGNGDFNAAMITAGVTYYLESANAYVSASLGLSRLSVTRNTSSGTATGATEVGFGLDLLLGKEWWVAPEWGLGVAGQFLFSNNGDQGVTWTTLGVGLLFSATYN